MRKVFEEGVNRLLEVGDKKNLSPLEVTYYK